MKSSVCLLWSLIVAPTITLFVAISAALTSPKDWGKLKCGHNSRRTRRNGAQVQRVWILISIVFQFKFLVGKEADEVAARVSSAVSCTSALWLSGRVLSSSDVGENNSMFSWCAAVASQHLYFWLMFTFRCLQTGAFKVWNERSSLGDLSPEPG